MGKNVSIKKAALINAVAKYSTVFLQLGFTAILSRILTPQEYGVVAVITVFVVFFQLFADSGFGVGIIQNKSLNDEDNKNIFSFTVYLGIILMILFMCASFPISFFYSNKAYIFLGFILSFSLMFSTWNMVPNALLLKNKRFVSVGIRTFLTALVAYTISLIIALAGGGVYALAIQSVACSLFLFLWNAVAAKVHFRFLPRWSSVKKIWGYSLYQFGAQALNYFNRNLDNLLIGKFFSEETLGYYNKSYSLVGLPVTHLSGVVTPVLHPVLSDHQDDYDFIYKYYLKLIRFLSLLGCFGAAFCWYASREIILVAFGNQWNASIVPFALLSLSIWGQMLTNTIGAIYQSIGKTKLLFYNLIISTSVIVSFIVFGLLTRNINYFSFLVSAAYILNFFISYFILIKIGFRKSLSSFLWSFKDEVLIFVVLMNIGLMWNPFFEKPIIGFLVKFAVFFGAYCLLLFITRQYKVFLNFFKKRKKGPYES